MKSLASSGDRSELLARLAAVKPDSSRRWGKMTPHQMICHLNDSFLCGLGERRASSHSGPLQRTIVKWFALWVPLHWPHGVSTRPENDQLSGGTPPVEFESDRARLAALVERFAAPGAPRGVHPLFGAINNEEWLRWGYLHADHHFRQFGV